METGNSASEPHISNAKVTLVHLKNKLFPPVTPEQMIADRLARHYANQEEIKAKKLSIGLEDKKDIVDRVRPILTRLVSRNDDIRKAAEKEIKAQWGEEGEPLLTLAEELEPSSSQIISARVEIFLKHESIIKNLAQLYLNWRKRSSEYITTPMTSEQEKEMKEYAVLSLYDLQKAIDSKSLRGFTNQHEDVDELLKLWNSQKDKMKMIEQDELKKAPYISEFDQTINIFKAGLHLTHLPQEERKYLLETIGYSPDEVRKILNAKASIIVTATGELAIAGSTFLGPLMPSLLRVNEQMLTEYLTDSYGVNFAAYSLATLQNIRALRNPNIGVCPNLFTLFSYMLARKIFPQDEMKQAVLAYSGTMLAAYAPEAVLSALNISDAGILSSLLRNTTSAAFQFSVASGLQILFWLKELQNGRMKE